MSTLLLSQRRLGHIYLVLAMTTVGSTVIASKLMAAGLDPFTATALRFAIAFPVFLAIMRVARTPWPQLTPQTWLLLTVQAGAGSVGYTTLLIAGLSLTTAADAGIVIGTLPIVASAFAVLVLRERLQARLLIGVALASAGVLLVSWPSGDPGRGSAVGNALVLGAVVCEAVFILLNKRLKTPIAPLALSTLMTGLGLAISAPVALAFEPGLPWPLDQTALLATAYYALVPTVAGFLLWYAGAARVSGAEAALFTAVAPITAVFMAWAILGEPITPAHLAGMACVIIAIIGTTMLPAQKQP